MKTTTKILSFLFLISCIGFTACKKDSTTAISANSLSPLSGSWTISAWGGVENNLFNFSIDATTGIGTITEVGAQSFGFTAGDKFLTSIIYNSPDRFNASGEYTYGTNNETSGTRAAILTLQNNNTQLTIDYPAINSDFQEIIYVFQKGSVTNVNL